METNAQLKLSPTLAENPRSYTVDLVGLRHILRYQVEPNLHGKRYTMSQVINLKQLGEESVDSFC